MIRIIRNISKPNKSDNKSYREFIELTMNLRTDRKILSFINTFNSDINRLTNYTFKIYPDLLFEFVKFIKSNKNDFHTLVDELYNSYLRYLENHNETEELNKENFKTLFSFNVKFENE